MKTLTAAAFAFPTLLTGHTALHGAEQAAPAVPGVVIAHGPASSGRYIGSPSIAVLPNGEYLASHDLFGPNSNENVKAITHVYGSADRGKTWVKRAEIKGGFRATLFVQREVLCLLGADRHHGNTVIRRSTDQVRTWATPATAETGLLRDSGAFRLYWRWKSRPRRPDITVETQTLTRILSAGNPLWGAERVRLQLSLLGYDQPCTDTILKYMVKPRRPRKPSTTWLPFLRNHLDAPWAIDFSAVPTLTFDTLFVFAALEPGRRRALHWNVTSAPSMAWVVQQLREAMPYGVLPCCMLIRQHAQPAATHRPTRPAAPTPVLCAFLTGPDGVSRGGTRGARSSGRVAMMNPLERVGTLI